MKNENTNLPNRHEAQKSCNPKLAPNKAINNIYLALIIPETHRPKKTRYKKASIDTDQTGPLNDNSGSNPRLRTSRKLPGLGTSKTCCRKWRISLNLKMKKSEYLWKCRHCMIATRTRVSA